MISRNTYYTLVAAAATLAAALLWHYQPNVAVSRGDVIGVVMLMGVAYFSDVVAFQFGNDAKFTTSIAQLPYLACIVLFQPIVAVPAITVAVMATNTYPQRRKPASFLFN